MVSSLRGGCVAVALTLLHVAGSTAWVAAPTTAAFGIRGVAACRQRSVPSSSSAPRRAVLGGLRAVEGGAGQNSENEQGGEREQSSMESWNEIMYSELRRRGAVTGDASEGEIVMPDPSLDPVKVITHVLTALLTNDEPFPDHGCAVAIRFSSENNLVARFTSRELGDFLRQGTYRAMVMDCSNFELLGAVGPDPPNSKGPQAYAQDVLIKGSFDAMSIRLRWYLSREHDASPWLTDSARHGPASGLNNMSVGHPE
ncbi:hypothetical protein T484DRAFT_1896483 [Baffinella frigidus]|nr:hypothetical protein T484DRAFT_1896483 [Cryptophyta sp. CCMP2293]